MLECHRRHLRSNHAEANKQTKYQRQLSCLRVSALCNQHGLQSGPEDLSPQPRRPQASRSIPSPFSALRSPTLWCGTQQIIPSSLPCKPKARDKRFGFWTETWSFMARPRFKPHISAFRGCNSLVLNLGRNSNCWWLHGISGDPQVFLNVKFDSLDLNYGKGILFSVIVNEMVLRHMVEAGCLVWWTRETFLMW